MFKHRYLSFTMFFAIILLISACGGSGFDPRLYNKKQNSTGGGEDGGVTEPDNPDVGLPVDPDNDPFLFAENSDPNRHFKSTEFDNLEMRATFSGNNTPSYAFAKGGWNSANPTKKEFSKGGPNSSGGGHSITAMHYYLYKGLNPVFSPNSSYNTGAHGDRVKRFYFYRFTGKGGGIQGLDNMLVAVDTYTKLVFSFSLPIRFTSVLGQQVPTAWGAVDTKVQNGKYKFYEYDPVGIVDKNGKVELYKWYTDAMGRSDYNPIIGSPDREVATYGKTGRSPYYTLAAVSTGDVFRDNVKSKEFVYRTMKQGKSEWLHSYSFSMDGKTLTVKREEWRTGKVVIDSTYQHVATISGTLAKYKSKYSYTPISITLKESSKELHLQYYSTPGRIDFTDAEPKFPDRVKGKVFQGAGYTYTFSNDGKSIRLSNGKTYNLTWRDEGRYAVYSYKWSPWSYAFWGVWIDDHASNGGVVVDGKITWTATSWSSPETTPPGIATEYPAYLK